MRVSILVPFRPERGPIGKQRIANWEWLEKRWTCHFPEAEIVVGTDDGGTPFAKTVAVNDAYSRSSGDMLVITDADSWVNMPQVIKGLHYAARTGVLVVPWTTAHRLSKEDSQAIRKLDPAAPEPVSPAMISRADGYRPSPSTAAMLVIVSREGFERVGGMDPRFRGWGAEDVAFGLACGTLLGRSHLMPGTGYALHHDRPRHNGLRVWQDDAGKHNIKLGDRYWGAKGKPGAMLALCAEHPLAGAQYPVSRAPGAGSRPVDQYVPVLQPEGNNHGKVLVRELLYGGTRPGDRIAL